MQRAALDSLRAKVRAGTASPEERAALDAEVVRRISPELAALLAAGGKINGPTPPEEIAAKAKRAYEKWQRREARQLTLEKYARLLQLKAQVLEMQAQRQARAALMLARRRIPTACRQPRSRRPRTCRARSPGRLADDDSDEPDLERVDEGSP